MVFSIPGEGRFLIAQLPMKGAVEAHVAFSRVSFEEGGHSWELVNGVPVCRADHLWVLHQPDFRTKTTGQKGDHAGLRQHEAGPNPAWGVGAAGIAELKTRRDEGIGRPKGVLLRQTAQPSTGSHLSLLFMLWVFMGSGQRHVHGTKTVPRLPARHSRDPTYVGTL